MCGCGAVLMWLLGVGRGLVTVANTVLSGAAVLGALVRCRESVGGWVVGVSGCGGV